MNVDNTLAWQRDMWRSMGMPEAAIDRHFSPGGLPHYRVLHQAGRISDDEMEMIEALWPTWGGEKRDLLKLVRDLLA
jgi:hypothetical protein